MRSLFSAFVVHMQQSQVFSPHGTYIICVNSIFKRVELEA